MLKELRQKLADKKRAGKAASAEFDALNSKAERTDAETARMAALDTELTALETDVEKLGADIARTETAQRRAGLFSGTSPVAVSSTRGLQQESDPSKFATLPEFAAAVRIAMLPGGTADQRLFAAAPPSQTLINQGTVGEGFLVPPDFSQAIWDLVYPGYGYDIMDLVPSIETEKNIIQLVKDETTPWGAAGVQVYWRGEGAVIPPSRLNFTGSGLPLHEIAALVSATGELLDDAPQLNDRLTNKVGQALRYAISKAIFQGTGVNQPLGFINGPATIVQAKEAGQAAGTINFPNVTKMVTRLPAGSFGNSVWLANIEIYPQLAQLNVGNYPVWIPASEGAVGAPGGRLLGRQIIFSEQALALGTPGDLALIDPNGYMLAKKKGGGLSFATSIHLYFDYNATAFRWIMRVGGQPLLTAPIIPANGTLTKGHVVTLQQR